MKKETTNHSFEQTNPNYTKQTIMENQPIQNQSTEIYVNPLTAPANYDLTTLLNELKFGRPANDQSLLQKWIDELCESKQTFRPNGTSTDIQTIDGIITNISDTPSNYQRGWNAAQKGLLQSDSWGDAFTIRKDNKPSNEELDEWLKGWNAYHYSNELAKNK